MEKRMTTIPLVLFEDPGWRRFGPLTLLRPVWEMRLGSETIGERIASLLDRQPHTFVARSALDGVVVEGNTAKLPARGDVFLVNGRFAGEPFLEGLDPDCPPTIWTDGADVAAARVPAKVASKWFTKPFYDPREYNSHSLLNVWNTVDPAPSVRILEANGTLVWWPWDLLERQEAAIEELVKRRGATVDGEVDPKAILAEENRIHLASGAQVMAGAILDASSGSILLEEGVKVMPGATILGPVALGRHTVVKPNAMINGHVSTGPFCKLGGEVEESIFLGYSNKQHEGFLGHSIVGQWVNLGAGTNNSDLKNNYSHVRVTISGEEIDTGTSFFGALLGDHVKTAIGTQLNTGTVIGIGSNLFGAGFPPKDIGAFRWGGADGFELYDFEKFIETARVVMARRDVEMSREMLHLLKKLHQEAAAYKP